MHQPYKNHLSEDNNYTPIATFTYDARNRCIKRVINSTTNYLYYDNWNLIEEYDASNNLLTSYIHGNRMDEILSRITPTTQIYYHHDSLGNITHLSDLNGHIVEKYVYDPFGKPTVLNATNGILQTSAYGNRFLFTGREYLQEIGLYDYRNRTYSPELGRFLQSDPIGFSAGDINIYRYCYNNPLGWIDPSGLAPGDPYPSVDAAAMDAMRDIYEPSVREDREYAGSIYENRDGSYSYTEGNRGGEHESRSGPIPPGTDYAAEYHSHGADSGKDWDDENFSPKDIEGTDEWGKPGYLVTPSGDMKKYEPDPNKKGKGKKTNLGNCKDKK